MKYQELMKLNEDNLIFITNPGRMGDEDGLTFIVKDGTTFTHMSGCTQSKSEYFEKVNGEWLYTNKF